MFQFSLTGLLLLLMFDDPSDDDALFLGTTQFPELEYEQIGQMEQEKNILGIILAQDLCKFFAMFVWSVLSLAWSVSAVPSQWSNPTQTDQWSGAQLIPTVGHSVPIFANG